MAAVFDARCVEGSANDVISDPWQVFDPSPSNQHNGVLLKVVSDATDISSHLKAGGEAHTSHLAKRRVGFFRRGGVNAGADTAPLWTSLQGRGFRFGLEA